MPLSVQKTLPSSSHRLHLYLFHKTPLNYVYPHILHKSNSACAIELMKQLVPDNVFYAIKVKPRLSSSVII